MAQYDIEAWGRWKVEKTATLKENYQSKVHIPSLNAAISMTGIAWGKEARSRYYNTRTDVKPTAEQEKLMIQAVFPDLFTAEEAIKQDGVFEDHHDKKRAEMTVTALKHMAIAFWQNIHFYEQQWGDSFSMFYTEEISALRRASWYQQWVNKVVAAQKTSETMQDNELVEKLMKGVEDGVVYSTRASLGLPHPSQATQGAAPGAAQPDVEIPDFTYHKLKVPTNLFVSKTVKEAYNEFFYGLHGAQPIRYYLTSGRYKTNDSNLQGRKFLPLFVAALMKAGKRTLDTACTMVEGLRKWKETRNGKTVEVVLHP